MDKTFLYEIGVLRGAINSDNSQETNFRVYRAFRSINIGRNDTSSQPANCNVVDWKKDFKSFLFSLESSSMTLKKALSASKTTTNQNQKTNSLSELINIYFSTKLKQHNVFFPP